MSSGEYGAINLNIINPIRGNDMCYNHCFGKDTENVLL